MNSYTQEQIKKIIDENKQLKKEVKAVKKEYDGYVKYACKKTVDTETQFKEEYCNEILDKQMNGVSSKIKYIEISKFDKNTVYKKNVVYVCNNTEDDLYDEDKRPISIYWNSDDDLINHFMSGHYNTSNIYDFNHWLDFGFLEIVKKIFNWKRGENIYFWFKTNADGYFNIWKEERDCSTHSSIDENGFLNIKIYNMSCEKNTNVMLDCQYNRKQFKYNKKNKIEDVKCKQILEYTEDDILSIISNAGFDEDVFNEEEFNIEEWIETIKEKIDENEIINDELDELKKENTDNEKQAIFNMIMLMTTYGQTHFNRVKEEYIKSNIDDIDSIIHFIDNHLLPSQKTEYLEYIGFDVYKNENKILKSYDIETLDELEDIDVIYYSTLWSNEIITLDN
jgi:hypothetical protein